jgi:hypothetical protein
MFEKKNLLKPNAEEDAIMKSTAYQVWRNTALLYFELVALPVFASGLICMGIGIAMHEDLVWILGFGWALAGMYASTFRAPKIYLKKRKQMWGIREEVE